MGILDKVVRLEKKIERLAARKDAPVTPMEIRRAILDDIEDQVQPAGRSKRVFPYDTIAIQVVGRRSADTGHRAALGAVLDPEEGLVDAIRERLHDAGCDRVGPLDVSVKVLKKPGADWTDETLFRVAYARSETPEARKPRGRNAAPPDQAPAAEPQPPTAAQAQILILQGTATKKAYSLTGERTNIGRQAEVTDTHRRVVRRNQVVFLDSDSEANQTVSRAQAHVRFTPPDEYRLYDDQSSYGTRIVREGRMIELPSGSPRGVKLRTGDEIYFGRARVLFQIK